MLYIDFDEAWQVYLDAQPRLPDFPPPAEPREVGGILDVVDDFDAVAFDAYGVLHVGGEGFPQARAALAELRRRGVRVAVLTNDVTHEPAGVAEGLRRRGFDFQEDEVISSRSVLPKVLDQTMPDGPIGLVSSHPEALKAQFPGMIVLGTDPAPYDDVEGFLFVDTNHWEDGHPDLLQASMMRRPRPMVVCNPDVGCPYTGRISAEPGYFAHRIAEATGASPVFLGKPFPTVYQRLFERMPDVRPERVLMVGDSPHTDILGARRMGMACLLVRCGFLQGRDVVPLFRQSGLWPDFVAAHP